MEKVMKKIDRAVIFFIVYTMVFLLFFSTLKYTIPFVLAAIFAILLRKPTEILMRKFHIKSSVACLITNLIFFTIIFLLLIWGVTSLTGEIVQLGKNTQVYIANNTNNIYSFFEKIQYKYNNINPEVLTNIKSYVSSMISKYSGEVMNASGKVVSWALSYISNLPYKIMIIFFAITATYFFTKDMVDKENSKFNFLSKYKTDKVATIVKEAKRMLTNYILSYGVIILLTFIETLIIFLVLRIKYAVILSIIAAIADILPVLGIGTIYVPLAIIYWFFMGQKGIAIALLICYGVVSAIRQVVEPKLVSSSLGIHPVAALAAIFIGLSANGFIGMIFCMFLVVFYNVLKKVNVL